MGEKELQLTRDEANLLVDCAQLVSMVAPGNALFKKFTSIIDRPDNYAIVHPLAKGGHSEVFVVRSIRTMKVYALKKVHKSHILSDPLVNPIMRERQSMISGRGSEWLLGLHRSFQDEHSLYFLTDFISGGDLGSLCCRLGAMPEETIRFYGGEILMALREMHGLGIIHRDLKPENVLIDSEGHIKLADFGSSTCTGGSDHDVQVGTPDYLAPEMLAMNGDALTPKLDLWALGVVLYELAFDITPFYSERVPETFARIIRIDYTIGECSEGLADLLGHLLCSEATRYTLEEAIGHRFFEGFDFTSKYSNVPVYKPASTEQGSVDNFEVDEFVPSRGEIQKPLDCIKAFAGFGYDPEITIGTMVDASKPKDEVEFVVAKEDMSTLGQVVEVGMHSGIVSVIDTSEKERAAEVPLCELSLPSTIVDADTLDTPPLDIKGDVQAEKGVKEGRGDKEDTSSEETHPNTSTHTLTYFTDSDQALLSGEEVLSEYLGTSSTFPDQLEPETSGILSAATVSDSGCADIQVQETYELARSTADEERLATALATLSMLQEETIALLQQVNRINVDGLFVEFEKIHGQAEEIIETAKERQKQDEEAAYHSRRVARRLQTELREATTRIDREVEIRTRLAVQKVELTEENRSLKEQIQRLKLGFTVRVFPVKIYIDNRWESTNLYLEETHIRIGDTQLPLNKTYFQSLKKNELLRMNSKGEALSFKLLLPSEEDIYTSQTESSSDQTIGHAEDKELQKELLKETAILEGIEKLLKAVSVESVRSKAMKQRMGTEKKILEIKQALAQGAGMRLSEPDTVHYNNHVFKTTTFSTGVQIWCYACNRLLYGTSKQGLLCKSCRMVCHKQCHTLVEHSCELHQAMERGTSIIIMAKHLEDKNQIKAIVHTGQS
ncbi:serine/threonine-protein kinase MRCK [Nematocida displodere]|uniref:Serine/threonine-protein kinase MRCK n=1 Tax=Nematocida displodere TaxID=1805483 RepID=A0A177EJP7_9MICR|nr:serine/threonine-protein kinase MRCK [Nematocida displodere]